MFEKLLDYIYAKDIKSESGLHPVLMSEASVSDRDNTIQVMYKQQRQWQADHEGRQSLWFFICLL